MTMDKIAPAASTTHVKVGKKDRHSKIRTARGLRDRRMRLSLKVARNFFDLQDMLGFEKASNTIEWLLNTSKVAIHQLARDKQHRSVEYNEAAMEMEDDKPEKEKRKRRKCSKAASKNNPLTRETRDKARARARERTREKMMVRSNPKTPQQHHHEASIGMIEHLLGITSPSSSSTITTYNSHEFPIIEPSCYAIGNVQATNIPNAPQHSYKLLSPSSIYMTNISNIGHQWSPSSVFSYFNSDVS